MIILLAIAAFIMALVLDLTHHAIGNFTSNTALIVGVLCIALDVLIANGLPRIKIKR